MQRREELLQAFIEHLYIEEKATATIEKYQREIERMYQFLGERELTKKHLLMYRSHLLKSLRVSTVNCIMSGINSYVDFLNCRELRGKVLRVQREAFIKEERELQKEEYHRLVDVAMRQGKDRLAHIMITLAATGIRISELPYITVEAVKSGHGEIRLKGKVRHIFFTYKLRKKLLKYIAAHKIKTGSIFVTKSGKPVDRSNVYHELKRLCSQAKVTETKVYPHNFRHMFARCYYAVEKNLSNLADILGHSKLDTTRIYVASTTREFERTLNKMDMVV